MIFRALLLGVFLLVPVAAGAVQDVVTDGGRIEGEGVTPTIEVERDIRFENGNDPQLSAAIAVLRERLGRAPENGGAAGGGNVE